MKMAEELQRELRSINRKSYPAYKGLKGAYQFPDYQLFIEHVQGDPFAAPSALRIFVPHSKAKFPERYYWDRNYIVENVRELHFRTNCCASLEEGQNGLHSRRKVQVRVV